MATVNEKKDPEGSEVLAKAPFLRRVRIRGYKSIAFCDVTLEPLTILVGRNASGKSNFVDALAFLRDLLKLGATDAVRLHGGRDALLCRVMEPSSFICLEIEAGFQPKSESVPWTGSLAVEVALPEKDHPRIVREHVQLESADKVRSIGYTVENGGRVSWEGDHSHVPTFPEWLRQDRLLLGMYGVSPFLGLNGIESIRTYNFNPEAMRRPQKPSPGTFLEFDGGNLPSVIQTTAEIEGWAVERVRRYLVAITGGVHFLRVAKSEGYESLQFAVPQQIGGQPASKVLPVGSASDGTLRAFGALMAAFQQAPPHGSPSLVAIEEPETALHPAAMRALVAALDEATLRTQIVLSTHSPDLLDAAEVKPDNVRVVQMIDGQTLIGPVDEAGVEIVARKLNSLGGLERENQLEPDLDDQDRQRELAEVRQEDRP
jgi:predicted ATPase